MLYTAINPEVVNKTQNHELFNKRFINKHLTPKKLLDHVLDGHAFCVSALKENADGYCRRKSENFNGSQIIGIDIDNTDKDKNRLTEEVGYWSYEDAISNQEINRTASFIYTTASHTEEHNRFRIIFVLQNKIEDSALLKKIIKIMTRRFSGDTATTSIVQGFYGSKGAVNEFFGNILDDKFINNMLTEAEEAESPEYKRISKMEFDTESFTKEHVDEIVSYIFKNGHIENEKWWKIPTILKNCTELTDSEIVKIVNNYVEVGDIWEKLKYAERYNEFTLNTLIFYAKKNGYELPPELIGNNKTVKFWTTELVQKRDGKEELKVHISYNLFDRFLTNNGFRIYEQDKGNQIIKIDDDNKINEITETQLRTFVIDYLDSEKDLYESKHEAFILREQYLRQSDRIINSSIKNLKSINSEITSELTSDSSTLVRIFYRNSFMEISKDGTKNIDYRNLKGYIWSKSVLDRNYNPSDGKKSVHQRFVELVCTDRDTAGNKFNREKYNSLKSSIGYLISKFKKKMETIAIVLTDESSSDASEGGTGKSIFNEAIGKIRNMTLVDGRNLNLDSPFHFSDVYLSTEIINVDDCSRSFNFEKLYHSITGDITIERKGVDRFTIPFDKAPKFCFSTNHIFHGHGNSHERRIFEIEFSNYFNASHTPYDEFGHELFTDWDYAEWNRFDDFMAECVQYYLQHGLVRYKQQNIEYKKLVENTSEELAEYFETFIKPDTLYKSIDVLEDFNQTQNLNISQTKLTQSIRYFAEKYKKFNFFIGFDKTLGAKIFVITDNDNKDLRYWKKSDQFTELRSKTPTYPSSMMETEFEEL